MTTPNIPQAAVEAAARELADIVRTLKLTATAVDNAGLDPANPYFGIADVEAARRMLAAALPHIGVAEQWRITGQPGPGYRPFDEVISNDRRITGSEGKTPEEIARRLASISTGWDDGPHLHRRSRIEGEWSEWTEAPSE